MKNWSSSSERPPYLTRYRPRGVGSPRKPQRAARYPGTRVCIPGCPRVQSQRQAGVFRERPYRRLNRGSTARYSGSTAREYTCTGRGAGYPPVPGYPGTPGYRVPGYGGAVVFTCKFCTPVRNVTQLLTEWYPGTAKCGIPTKRHNEISSVVEGSEAG
eukprot:619598-Rhodomonas_salina.2